MHMHTSEVSLCANRSAREQVRYYRDRGFAGICVTDHFLNGNTSVPKDLPWEERVRRFCQSYEAARDEGETCGISVFFGWEYPYHGTDFLTYGLSPAWLLLHPEILDCPIAEYGDYVHRHGGFIVHAHPFREAHYIDMIRLMPRQVDGVEILNANRTDFENEAARDYAERYGLLPCVGSDNHTGEQKRLCALCSPRRLIHVQDMIRLLQHREAAFVTLPGGAESSC